MHGNNDLERMLHALQREPWMTALHRRLLLDTSGQDTAGLHARLHAVAVELASMPVPDTLTARREVAAMGAALQVACAVLQHVWHLLHGRALPPLHTQLAGAETRAQTSTAAADESADDAAQGLPALLQTLAEIAVLAALCGRAEAGERLRAAIAVLVPNFRDHEVPYALALMFNGRHALAEAILAARLDDDDGGRRRSAYALVRHARGAADWQREFERVAATSLDDEVRHAATHWLRLLQTPLAA